MIKLPTSDKTKLFSSLLRWILGALFVAIGILYRNEGGWPAILFGIAFFVTGFIRPRRCTGDNCTLTKNQSTKANFN